MSFDRLVKVFLDFVPRNSGAARAALGPIPVPPGAGGAGGAGANAGPTGFGALAARLGQRLTGLSAAAGPAALAVGAVALAMATGMKVLSDGLRMAAIANPAAAERLNRATMDAHAVIGQRFVPLMDLFTDGVRLAGDILASILPSSQDVRAALQPLRDVLDDMRGAAGGLTPILRTMLTTGLQNLASTLTKAAGAVQLLIKALEEIPGFHLVAEKLKSGVGAAPGSASFMGVEDYLSKAYVSAYSSGSESNPNERSANLLEKINAKMDGVLGWADYLLPGVGNGPAVARGVAGSVISRFF